MTAITILRLKANARSRSCRESDWRRLDHEGRETPIDIRSAMDEPLIDFYEHTAAFGFHR